PGLMRIFELNGTGVGDDFEDHVDVQSSWFDFGRHLTIQGERIFASGFLFGNSSQEIYRIGLFEADAGQWGLQRTLETGPGQYYETSLHHQFVANESAIYGLKIEDRGQGIVEDLQWIAWPIDAGTIAADYVVLGDRESLDLPEWDGRDRLGGMLVHDDVMLIGDTSRGFHSAGAVVRVVLVDLLLERRADISPPLSALVRSLGASLAAGNGQLAVGAPGWCRVYLLREGESQPFPINSPRALDSCGGFGGQVAFHEDRLVVGASFESLEAFQSGAVYVLNPTDGTVLQTLTPQVPEGLTRFGRQVLTHDDRLLIVGAEIAVYEWSGSSYVLIQQLPIVVPGGFGQGSSFDTLGATVVLAAYSNFMGSVEVLAWNGASYDQPEAPIQEFSSQFGSGLLLVSGNRLLISSPSERRLRDYRFNGTEWTETNSIWGFQPGFGVTMARTPCGILVADSGGLSRFRQIGDIPGNGLRLDYQELPLFPTYPGSVNLINFDGRDYLA
ncbi:MAG: hypothetical protein ACNA7J_14835, partial [Wenzhouxiangella sp.]